MLFYFADAYDNEKSIRWSENETLDLFVSIHASLNKTWIFTWQDVAVLVIIFLLSLDSRSQKKNVQQLHKTVEN